MATLGAIFAGSWAASGGAKPKTAAGPPINASSKEEGDFIQYVSCFLCFWAERNDTRSRAFFAKLGANY